MKLVLTVWWVFTTKLTFNMQFVFYTVSRHKQVKMPNNLYIRCLCDSNSQLTKRHKCNFSWIKILMTPNSIYPEKEAARRKNTLKRSERDYYPAAARPADGCKGWRRAVAKSCRSFPNRNSPHVNTALFLSGFSRKTCW
jgi:hypothetical protein